MVVFAILIVSTLGLLYLGLLIGGIMGPPRLPQLTMRATDNLLDKDVAFRLNGLDADYGKDATNPNSRVNSVPNSNRYVNSAPKGEDRDDRPT